MEQLIDYISTNPGVGKTHYVIQKLLKAVLTKTQISIYVAPTIQLLEQVQEDLKKLLHKEFHKKLIIFKHEKMRRTSVAKDVANFLTKTADNIGLKRVATPEGSVILLTHEGFLTLMPDLYLQHKIQLFFDEARHCVTEKERVKLDNIRQSEAINSLCVTIDALPGAEQFKRITCKPNAFKELLRLDDEKGLGFDEKQLAKLKPYLKAASNPRLDVYFRYDEFTKKPNLDFFEIVVPSRVFKGFKSVTLLSAFFEDSQMYYLLKPHLLNNITSTVDAFKERIYEIRQRYEKVDIVSLTKHTDTLTLKNLVTGVLLNRSLPEPAAKIVDLNKVSSLFLPQLKMILAKPGEYVSDSAGKTALKIIKDNPTLIEGEPLSWYIRESSAVIKKWGSKYPVIGKPLLFVNNNFQNGKTLSDVPLPDKENFELLRQERSSFSSCNKSNAVINRIL
jgi:hypothetical protein